MPKILDLSVIGGDVWARVGTFGDYPSGLSLLTPDELEREKQNAVEVALAEKALDAIEAEQAEEKSPDNWSEWAPTAHLRWTAQWGSPSCALEQRFERSRDIFNWHGETVATRTEEEWRKVEVR